MSTRTRHWKQRWDPSAPLVYAKRLRMGDNPKKPFVMPGDKVTKKHREKLGLNRLKAWFENGTVQLANFKAPDAQRRLAIIERKKREQLDARVNAAAEEQAAPSNELPTENEEQGDEQEAAQPAGE